MSNPLRRFSLLALASLPLACGGDEAPEREQDPEIVQLQADAQDRLALDRRYEQDQRLRVLMQSLDLSKGYYSRDTGDTIEILIEKLEFSPTEVLHRTKEDLAQLGPLAVPELIQLINRYFEDPGGNARLQNSIEVLAMSDAPSAHAGLVRCLDHPRNTIRAAALRALAKGKALPADFDRLLIHLETEGEAARKSAASALFVADPNRAGALTLDWIETGQQSDLLALMVNQIHTVDPDVLGQRAGDVALQVHPQLGLPIAAVGAQAGHAGAIELLREGLKAEDGIQRTTAVAAQLETGNVEPLIAFITEDPDPLIRGLVVGGVAEAVTGGELELTPALLNQVHAALEDPSPDVRKQALGALLRWKDPTGIDRALALLGSDRLTMQETISVLGPVMATDTQLTDRVLDQLIETDRSNAHRPLTERLSVLQAIGQTPRVEAAAYLWELALSAEGELQGMRAFRWLTTQAANSGDAGRALLASKLPETTDLLRRIDLIWAASSQRTDASRTFLIDFLESDPDPYEMLFAGDRLAQMGPAATVAPILKRVALRIEHGRIRAAFDSLLWRWY